MFIPTKMSFFPPLHTHSKDSKYFSVDSNTFLLVLKYANLFLSDYLCLYFKLSPIPRQSQEVMKQFSLRASISEIKFSDY